MSVILESNYTGSWTTLNTTWNSTRELYIGIIPALSYGTVSYRVVSTDYYNNAFSSHEFQYTISRIVTTDSSWPSTPTTYSNPSTSSKTTYGGPITLIILSFILKKRIKTEK
jgi:hypothetical protein